MRIVRIGHSLSNAGEIAEKHIYVVIHGGMDWPKKLRFMTDLFGKMGGVKRQIVYEMLSD